MELSGGFEVKWYSGLLVELTLINVAILHHGRKIVLCSCQCIKDGDHNDAAIKTFELFPLGSSPKLLVLKILSFNYDPLL